MASDPHEYLHQSLGQAKKPHACVVTIFGASGDLTKRKLIPALYNLALEKRLPERFAVVGYARSEMSHEAFRDKMREAVQEFSRTGLKDEAVWNQFASTLYYVRGGYDDSDGYESLKQFIDNFDHGQPGTAGAGVLPGNAAGSLRHGHRADLRGRFGAARRPTANRARASSSRKPFGTDLQTARELNRRVHEALGRKADLPNRSLSRQRDRAKHHGVPFRQRGV